MALKMIRNWKCFSINKGNFSWYSWAWVTYYLETIHFHVNNVHQFINFYNFYTYGSERSYVHNLHKYEIEVCTRNIRGKPFLMYIIRNRT